MFRTRGMLSGFSLGVMSKTVSLIQSAVTAVGAFTQCRLCRQSCRCVVVETLLLPI